MNSRLKSIRIATGLSVYDFGQNVGLSGLTVKTLENGSRTISGSIISKICEKYSVSEDWLRYGTGDMFIAKKLSTLSVLKSEYSLSDDDEAFLRTFINMPSEKRSAFYDFMQSFSNNG